MKNFLSICGVVCFILGFAMATGVDQNPVQAIYALVLMGAACVCMNATERIGKQVKNRTNRKAAMRPHKLEDAA